MGGAAPSIPSRGRKHELRRVTERFDTLEINATPTVRPTDLAYRRRVATPTPTSTTTTRRAPRTTRWSSPRSSDAR